MKKAAIELCSFSCAASRAKDGEPIEVYCGECERVEKFHCRPWADTSEPLPTENTFGYVELGGLRNGL